MQPLRSVVVAALVAVPALALAGDVLETLGLERRDVEDSVVSWASHGEVWVPGRRSGVKAVPAGQRARLVRALGEVAKAWTKTDAFKARWEQERRASLPKEPVQPRDGAQAAAEQKAKFEGALQDAEKVIASMPPEQREAARQAFAAAREQMARNEPSAKVAGEVEKERFEREKAEYDAALAVAMPQSPREGLRLRLETLLERTDQVDFKAKLVAEGGVQRFAAKDLEARPPEWKLCFRAGREACEAARSFAMGWLAELR